MIQARVSIGRYIPLSDTKSHSSLDRKTRDQAYFNRHCR
jgi:hypothetical protein